MAPVQTAYTRRQIAAQNGQPATMSGWDADTKQVETAAGIGFGKAVSLGTNWDQVVLGGAADFIGVTYRDVTQPGNVGDEYPQNASCGVMVRGDIWVTVEDAVAAGDPVEYNATTGVLGSDGGVAVHDARWIKGASAGGIALLRLGSAASPVDLDTEGA